MWMPKVRVPITVVLWVLGKKVCQTSCWPWPFMLTLDLESCSLKSQEIHKQTVFSPMNIILLDSKHRRHKDLRGKWHKTADKYMYIQNCMKTNVSDENDLAVGLFTKMKMWHTDSKRYNFDVFTSTNSSTTEQIRAEQQTVFLIIIAGSISIFCYRDRCTCCWSFLG